MNLKTLVISISMLTALTLSPYLAFAGAKGGSNGGGGSDMETEFKAIALNIGQWIQSGRSAHLKLPRKLTNAQYRAGMLAELGSYSIEMTSEELKYGGSVKTCVSRQVPVKDRKKPKVRNQILCNQNMFRDTYKYNTEGAYRLVHHEFAGLARLEQNRGQESDYTISDQIGQYLERETVLRLPVETAKDPEGLRTMICGGQVLVQSHHEDGGNEIPVYGAYPSEVSARDFVVALLKDKNSFLFKAINEKKILIQPNEDEDGGVLGSNFIGETVSAGNGGRVESNYTDSLIPIFETGKRYEGLTAYVRVHETTDSIFSGKGIPVDPKAMELRVLRVTGVLVVDEASKSFELPGSDVEFDAKSCRATSIPKLKSDDNVDL